MDLWNEIWKDKKGRVVIWQMPNAYLWAWLGLTALSLFFTGTMANVLTGTGSVVLIGWSILEITKGVNYFRRALGLVVLILAVMSLIKSL